jgi:hypothetical protein
MLEANQTKYHFKINQIFEKTKVDIDYYYYKGFTQENKLSEFENISKFNEDLLYMCSHLLLLPNTDRLQQVEYYVRIRHYLKLHTCLPKNLEYDFISKMLIADGICGQVK